MGIEVAGEKGSRFVDDHLESQEISRIEESGEEAEGAGYLPRQGRVRRVYEDHFTSRRGKRNAHKVHRLYERS